MPYGSDITEGIPYGLSNPSSADTYQLSTVQYDVAIAGLPFFLGASDDSPYRRVTAQYRKTQIDQTREPGEQTLTGWWLRSQSSFHQGAGIKYYEPIQDESLRFQFTESKGCDIWTKGQVTLLNTTVRVRATSATNLHLFGARDTTNNVDAIVFTEGGDLKKLTMSTASGTITAVSASSGSVTYSTTTTVPTGSTVTILGATPSGYNGTFVVTGSSAGTSFTVTNATTGAATGTITFVADIPTITTYTLVTSPHTLDFLALTTDGSRYFAPDNARIHRGNIFGTTSDGHIYDLAGPVTNIVLKYAKQRLLLGTKYKLYELDANKATTAGGHALPTEFYTHPNPEWLWTAIAEGPAAFYVAGYAGANSSIYKITLDAATANSLGFPELNVPTVVVDLPEGEIVQAFDVYLGTYAVICTNKGVRVGVVSADGDISYGPLLFDGDCKAVTFANQFAYVTGSVGGESGLIRIDLSGSVTGQSLIFPYAWDIYAGGETVIPMSTDFLGISGRPVFGVAGDGIWVQSASTKVLDAYLRTGYVRYNTIEAKIFKFLQARFDATNGSLDIESIAANNATFNIGSFNKGAIIPEVSIAYPSTPQEYLGFKFIFGRDPDDSTKGPLFTGYQLKALPAVPRQRLIQLPVFCYDHESDSLGVEIGYEGSAYDRLTQLEAVENNGDTIRVQDFRSGEEILCIIEELDFINQTPSDKRFSGFGGKLIVTVRTI